MEREVYNFLDGQSQLIPTLKKLSALEALITGSWYYGTVALHDVVKRAGLSAARLSGSSDYAKKALLDVK